jgi:glycosyltransferase involved in cell wall biosynthesis
VRILLATNYQPPHTGGIQYAAESLRRCWINEGHSVTWLSTDIPRGARESTPDNIRIPSWNVLEKFQAYLPFINPLAYPQIVSLVKDHDVVSVHSVAPTLSVAALYAALTRQVPTVLTQHVGVIPLAARGFERGQQRYIAGIARWSVRRGARMTFVGKGVRDWFVERAGIPAGQTDMTPAGIDQDDFYLVPDDQRRTFRRKWNLPEGKFSVLFVARFLRSKGIHLLPHLIERCPGINFTLVGNGPRQEPFDWVYHNLRVIKKASVAELRELYGSHDLLFMPSVGEGWPAVVCQGMACGLPALVSEECFDGYREDPEYFLIRTRHPDLLTQTLLALAEGRLALPANREAIADYARAHWDWKKTARIYLDIFQQVRNPSPGVPA